ncbi:YadA family autotransporter adhesin [Variovorax sp. JS1663]|uniref:YadA family autotransporter adhesin n=1 Tax=Variovorax sp. JS1663 TaxID=1851577 RepID=UPI00117E733A|nr:YadA-like family protein [Variovorax sp. JS1663]
MSLGIGTTQAQTSIGTTPKPQPTPPPKVTTSTTQVGLGQASCAQQLDDRAIALQKKINDVNIGLLTTQAATTTADIAGLAAEAVGAVIVAAEIPGIVAQGAAAAANLVGLGLAIDAHINSTELTNLDAETRSLPSCDQTFTGTVTVDAGGADVTGDSIFNNNLAVRGQLDVAGAVSTNSLDAAQGISAMGGALRLGNADGQTYAPGITVGGGAVSGLGGNGRPAAQTADPDAIAIGNGSIASTATSTALGTGAQATANATTALGAGSQATGARTTAVGAGSQAVQDNSTAAGASALATGLRATAVGATSNATAADATAIGHNTSALGAGATAVGAGSQARALDTVIGYQARATADGAFVGGARAAVSSPEGVAIGFNAAVAELAPGAIAIGSRSTIAPGASGAIAIGAGAQVSAANAAAYGEGAAATAASSVALGQGSLATRVNTVSIGRPGGERQISNVAPGTAGTDAVNVNQLQALATQTDRDVQTVADNAHRELQTVAANAHRELQVVAATARRELQVVASNAYRGVAMTAALSEGVPELKPGETAAFAGVGSYRGYGAIAVGLVHMASNARMRYSVGIGTTGSDAVMRAGLSYRFND